MLESLNNDVQEYLKQFPTHLRFKILNKFKANYFKKNFFEFCKFGLNYNEMTSTTHGPICQALASESKRKLIVVPRSCFKSSIATISYSIWRLTKNPNERILIDSELYTNSKRFLREIKAHLESKYLVEMFGEFKGDVWTEGEIVIKQRTKAYKESSITCSGIGAEKTSQHYSVIIADDLNSTQNINTLDLRQKVINHYRLYTSLLEPDGTLVVIGTRYHEQDLIGWILENEIDIENKKVLNL